MPQLGLSVNHDYESRKAPRPDKFGRRVRVVNGVAPVGESKPFAETPFFKIAASLAIVATLAMSVALVRLFTFPH